MVMSVPWRGLGDVNSGVGTVKNNNPGLARNRTKSAYASKSVRKINTVQGRRGKGGQGEFPIGITCVRGLGAGRSTWARGPAPFAGGERPGGTQKVCNLREDPARRVLAPSAHWQASTGEEY